MIKHTSRLLAVWLVFVSAPAVFAQTPWEVSVMFLGAKEPQSYQIDIDRNIEELGQIVPGEFLGLNVYRERPGQYSTQETMILNDSRRLGELLSRSFSNPDASRVLIIYSHGFAFDGLRGISLKQLRKQLDGALPARPGRKPLDILWFDACYMGNIETFHELRELSDYLVGSQDAEFSAGMPFDSLEELASGPDDPAQVARSLARRFVESYSYLKEGTQRSAAYSSAATVAVVKTERLDAMVDGLSKLVKATGSLGEKTKAGLRRNASMLMTGRDDLIDLGSFLTKLKKSDSVTPATKNSARKILKMLGLNNPASLKTNPRIKAVAPEPDSMLVYGYEDWTRGFDGDEEVLGKLPRNLKPVSFRPGPNERAWPARVVRKRLYLAPFSVGLSTFNFFFMDPNGTSQMTSSETYVRSLDYVMAESPGKNSPIIFTAYTQGIGATSERYSGLSILDPALGAATTGYVETDFAEKTGWLKLTTK